MASEAPLPCWLTARDKFVINSLLREGFHHYINHQSEADEDDELCFMQKVCGYKVGFAGCDNYISVIINGCQLSLYLGDEPPRNEAERAFSKVKRSIRRHSKAWESYVKSTYKQLTFC
jgi:hypothetical protein